MATLKEVEAFLATTTFDSYQSVPLPHGRSTPGRDHSARADVILGDRVRGKSVLDIGTNYGYFPFEAIRRGAARAVGVETHPQRYAVAKRISEFHGGAYDVVHGSAEDLAVSDPFDIVLCLNVLHHLTDPVSTITKLAGLCKETLVLEFPTPRDRIFLHRELASRGLPKNIAARAGRRVQRWMLATTIGGLSRYVGLVAVGSDPYQNTYHFSREALERIFTSHHPLFSRIQYVSSSKSDRSVAICKVARQETTTADSGLYETVEESVL